METEIDIYSLDAFTNAYIECMLWSSTDYADESGGAPLDDNYGVSDIAQESLRTIVQDCQDFQESNERLLSRYYNWLGMSSEQAGHDFWLTRNGHGAGFWDRGHGRLGDALSKAAKAYGGIDPMVDDQGKVHVS